MPLAAGGLLVTGTTPEGFVLATLSDAGAARILWSSVDTWLGRAFFAPDGRTITTRTITFEHDLLTMTR